MNRILQYSLFAVLCCFMTLSAAAKKPKVLEGSLDALKGTKKMNIQFVYEGMTIGDKKIPDAEYIEKRKAEMNEKEHGTGDHWALAWVNDRSRKFELSFKNQFNKDSKIRVGNFPEEKYTFIFKSINLEPGYNVAISKKPAKLDGEAWIVETANPQNVICKLQVTDAVGQMMFADLDNGERIRYSYIMAAHILQEYIENKLF